MFDVTDVPVTAEELEGVLTNVKKNKSSGPDGVSSKHILFGGESGLQAWILRAFQAAPACLLQMCYNGKDSIRS